jgi:hypothetical protein
LPGGGKGRDGATGSAADDAFFRIVGELVLLAHLGQQFLDEHAHVFVVQHVVFVAPVVRIAHVEIRGIGLAEISRCNEHADGDRHLLLADHVLHGLRHAQRAIGVGGALAVLEHQQVGGLGLFVVVLRGNEDPVAAHRAGDDLALELERAFEAAFGDAFLRQ